MAEGGTIGRGDSEGAEMTHIAEQDLLLPELPEPSEEAARPKAPREASEATYD